MPGQKDTADLVADLEKRIDTMQTMDDGELGSFGRLDWAILVVISIVIPVIAVVLAR